MFITNCFNFGNSGPNRYLFIRSHRYQLLSVLNLLSLRTLEEKIYQLGTLYPNANMRLGIPHLKAGEALHGICLKHATSFHSPLAMGSIWDPEVIEKMGRVVAKEARALGTHQVKFLNLKPQTNKNGQYSKSPTQP